MNVFTLGLGWLLTRMLQRSPRPIFLFLAFAPVLSAAEEVTSDEEQTGLTVAVALEQVLTRVIADAEVSVVPIAIFRAGGVAESDRGIGGRGFRVADPESTPSLDAVPDIYATGVVVSDRGLVLTNHHVIRGAEKGSRIFIRTPGRPLWDEMRIKASDPYGDLAILEGISPDYAGRKWRPMPLGDGSALKKGQIVISLGNPFALARDGEVSAGWGIVSNLRRRLPAESNTAGGPAPGNTHPNRCEVESGRERWSAAESARRDGGAYHSAFGDRGARTRGRLCGGGRCGVSTGAWVVDAGAGGRIRFYGYPAG